LEAGWLEAELTEGSVLEHDAGELPAVIQGGMGVAVSSWRLARAVSAAGQLGVVSGTALDAVLARRLQDGDPGGHARAALAAFPVPAVAARVLDRYFRPGGRAPGVPYAPVPRLSLRQDRHAHELAVAANFAEVWLAKRGHDGPVGVNYLEKIQMAAPAAAYGAMLAGVDVVLAGAGIPREMPRLLGALARHDPASVPVEVTGAPDGARYTADLDPAALLGSGLPPLRRPAFLAVVSSHVLAEYLARDPLIRPDGFVIEGPLAGGHNAPPRGRLTLDDDGQPRYGPRDDPDLVRVAAVGLPFWLAGGYGTPAGLAQARAVGAAGVQAGTLFALSRDSGLRPDLRAQLLTAARAGRLRVRTDPAASPTGFPFKVVQLPGTLADPKAYDARPRLCDLGYLRVPYVRSGGAVGYRCPGEPVHTYLRKGGAADDTAGRSCLCNALLANVGLGQTRRDGYAEDPLVTLGSGLDGLQYMLGRYPDGWSAAEAVTWLLAGRLPSGDDRPAGRRADDRVQQAHAVGHRPLDVAQPLDPGAPGLAPGAGLNERDQLVGGQPVGVRERGLQPLAVLVVVGVPRRLDGARELAGPLSQELGRRRAARSPGALDQDEPAGRGHGMPCRQRLGGRRQGPHQVPLDHRAEVVNRRVLRVCLDDLDRQAPDGRLGAQPAEHARRQVHGRDMVALRRQEQRQEPRAGPDVEHLQRRRRQQPAQRCRPRRDLLRPLRVVVGRLVIRLRVRVPVAAHLAQHVRWRLRSRFHVRDAMPRPRSPQASAVSPAGPGARPR
jgi:NAD(P)H-dependent flavin oxidoreductase YrpB (nitropropane dioxygenase family)